MANSLLPLGGERAGTPHPTASRRETSATPETAAARLLDLQRAAGNRAVGGLVQRQLTIHGKNVTEKRITSAGKFRTGLDQVIAAESAGSGYTPADVRARLVRFVTGGPHAYPGRRVAVRAALKRLRNSEWRHLKTRTDILYGNPPLTEAAARTIVERIEKGDPDALQGLQRNGTAYQVIPQNQRQRTALADANRSHEWGILKAKGHGDQCMLVIGDPTGVTWAPFLRCGIAVGHSHPYFETGSTRNRYGRIELDTKEIADHPNLPAGMISWQALDTKAGEASTEVAKIFPSASDIAFSGLHGLPRHTVNTPYAVTQRNGLVYIANPEIGAGVFRGMPRLVFVIRNAVLAADQFNYQCTLDATRDGGPAFWSKAVTTNGIGQFGMLRW